MEKRAEILMVEFVTHDVKRFIIEKPDNYEFIPGQATEVSIDKEEWVNEKRPFTFTSLNSDKVLEFTIKSYPEHNGATKAMHELKPGDNLVLRDVWGTINYKGKGIFIAAGAGITPFISIFRQLREEGNLEGNKLFFSNKTQRDVILEKELREMFPEEDLILTLTRENKEGYENRRIDEDFLKEHIKDINTNFYLCGPPKMVDSVKELLKKLGAKADSVIFEE